MFGRVARRKSGCHLECTNQLCTGTSDRQVQSLKTKAKNLRTEGRDILFATRWSLFQMFGHTRTRHVEIQIIEIQIHLKI